MTRPSHVSHMNVARLRFPPGDSRVAGFVDNVSRVNAIAERSPGFIWRHSDDESDLGLEARFQALDPDPHLAISLSVWESAQHLRQFVNKTVHGGFLRRRAEWFEPWPGPNYVVWNIDAGGRPTIEDGWSRLAHLAQHGPTLSAYDFKFAGVAHQGQG
jgi:heme-degrading monooxygenase HmoA